MKKSKLSAIKDGHNYLVKYELGVNDVVDTKVFDMSNSGAFPQMCPCEMTEENGARTFNYRIENKMPVPEFLKREINKKQMLTLLYNVLSGLEGFGKNMVSLSYVAKASKYIFVDAESLEVCFIVAAVDKDVTDMAEIKDVIKSIIADAKYFELDKDNYVAKLISFTNKSVTFSTADMKEYVNRLLLDIGVHIEEEKAAKAAAESQAPNKVSRVGVMMNNAKMNNMNQQAPMPPIPPMGGANGAPQMPPMGGINGAPQMPPMGRPNGVSQMPFVNSMNDIDDDQKTIVEDMSFMESVKAEVPKEEKVSEKEEEPKAPEMPTVPEMPKAPVNDAPQQVPTPYLLRRKTNERIYLNKEEFTIGKSATKADYTITDNPAVSRIHCIVTRRNGVSYIRDNNSTNGTFVNNEELLNGNERFLTNNATVTLGDEEFTFFIR